MKKGWFGMIFLALLVPGLMGACVPKDPHQPLAIVASPVDPKLIRGTLPNGFQYLVMKNTTPKDRVSIHLNVFSGSAHEREEERGLAHYLEHMLFNGSEHFKPGELITYFQSIGMDFGADANARTSFFSTIYDLNLPKGDQKHLEDAFLVIQDYACGALILEEEVDRERGVILAEKRERDSVSFRTFKETLAFEMPGSLLPERLPIGINEVIETADQALLKGYYDQWYRPDNMALVVVGDVDTKLTEKLIKKRFARLTDRSEGQRPEPDIAWTPHQGLKPFYLYEPEAGKTAITLERIEYLPFEPGSVERMKQEALTYLGDYMLEKRLSRMIREQKAKFTDASAYTGQYLRHLSLAAVQAACEPGDWDVALTQLENSLRSALTFGFTSGELERAKADYLSSLVSGARGADTRKSDKLAKSLLRALNRNDLFLSPEQRLALLEPFIASLALDDVNKAYKTAWDADHRLVLVTGNADIGNGAKERIASVYRTANAAALNPYDAVEVKAFPYLTLPSDKAAVIRHDRDVKGLGIDQITFANQVRLNLKPTDFKAGEFSFKAVFGRGLAGIPPELSGLSKLAETTVKESGFGRMDLDQLKAAVAGRDVKIGFKIRESAFTIEGTAAPDEAQLVFQLLYAYLNDPGCRPKGLALAKARYRQAFEALERTPDGIMKIQGARFLAGDDPRFGLGHPDLADKVSLDQVTSWLKPAFSSAPLELSIAGDFDPKTVMMAADEYLGALAPREKPGSGMPAAGKISFPAGRQQIFHLDTRIEKGMVRVAFLTDDYWDIMQTRKLSILSRIFSERLRKRVREVLGASYSPYVYNDPSLIYPDYGVLSAVVAISPDTADLVYEQVAKIARDLFANGVRHDELPLVLQPVLNHLAVLRQSNTYWLNSVMAGSFRHPERLDWATHLVKGYEGITAKDLSLLAARYLDMEKSAKVLILPK